MHKHFIFFPLSLFAVYREENAAVIIHDFGRKPVSSAQLDTINCQVNKNGFSHL